MFTITKNSGIYTLKTVQDLKININDAWTFFSNPFNLEEITPSNMGFKITSIISNQTYCGQIITYRIGIFPIIKTNWVTEITHLEPGKYFIDEQRYGPYKMWHHEHHFESTKNGVLMTDIVSYKLPFGFIGHVAHKLFIKSKIESIFKYRMTMLNNKFN